MDNYYSYHPMSILGLGFGFDPADLSAAKIRCVTFTEDAGTKGALGTTFSEVLVRDSTQLKSALSLDLSIDASCLLFKGSGSFSYDYSSLFETDSLTAVLSASSQFGSRTMKEPALDAAAEALIASGKMDEFADRYGKAVVVQEDRGASVSIIITIANISSETMQKINTSMSASGGFGPFSASAKTAFQSETQQASKEGRINIQVLSTGGEGFGALSDVVASVLIQDNSFEKVQAALGIYLKSFTMENSAPIGFHTQSMSAFGWKPKPEDADPVIEQKQRKLLYLVDQYRNSLSTYNQINAILDGTDPRSKLMDEDDRNLLTFGSVKYKEYLDTVAITYANCKADVSPAATGCDIPADKTLPPVDDLVNSALSSLLPEPPSGYWMPSNWDLTWMGRPAEEDKGFIDLRMAHPSLDDFLNQLTWFYVGSDLLEITEASLLFNDVEVRSFTNLTPPGVAGADTFSPQRLSIYAFLKGQFDAGKESGGGTFFFRLKDNFNRTTRVPMLSVEWNKVASSFAVTSFDLIRVRRFPVDDPPGEDPGDDPEDPGK